MPWATSDGVSIYYERDGAGSDDGETVVFLQGLGYGRWLWRWQREAFADEFDVIAPDTRGTGRSDVAIPGVVQKLPGKVRSPLIGKLFGYTIDELAADLEAVLEEAEIYEAHLVGAGLGGAIALRYAFEYSRAASLTLCSTTHGGVDAVPMPGETRKQLFETPKGATERQRVRHRMRPVFSDRFTNRNPHLMDRIIEWRLEQDASEPARTAQWSAWQDVDVSEQLWALRVPTLVLHGSSDRLVPVANARLLAEKLPDSHLEVRQGGSHLFFLEDPEWANERIREFLAPRVAP